MDEKEQANRATSQLLALAAPAAFAPDDAKAAPAPSWGPRWLQPRDRLDFEAIVRRGRSALAWEVLRRDPAYRAAHAVMPKPAAADVAASRAFTVRWGLHFP